MSKRYREDEDCRDAPTTANVRIRKKIYLDAEGEGARRPIRTAFNKILSHHDYTIGWVCALPLEMAAAVAMLDEIHTNRGLVKHPNDNNTYTVGEINNHNIAIACLPFGVYGTTSAATVASQMSSTFTSIRHWLMVGIGGGAPSAKVDIRLGDIVVSKGVVQHDYGKTVGEGQFERTGLLNKPSQTLLTAVAKLQAEHERVKSRIPEFLSEMLQKNPHMATKYTYRGQEQDTLFEAEYEHVSSKDTCEGCNKTKLVSRAPRAENYPVVHYGRVASANQVMKHGATRDRLERELDIICFEMEAAGLMDNFPCLIIRGICDYSDSHKNKQWQEYSAATAAAYAKELLFAIPAARAVGTPRATAVATPELIEQRQSFMEALKFDQIDARQATIKSAHAKTCKWLLTKPEYRDWLDVNLISDHHGFLWIKGKPGTGKSTIMKFALKHAEETIKSDLIISFFFNARGENLEKSTIGMYRSLLYQLLKKGPKFQFVFDSWGSLLTSGNSDAWGIEMLQETFSRALGELGQRRLICFIDALDECEEDQIRDMIAFFEGLGQFAVSAGIQLHVCFSSRHYPHITINKGRELILEGQEGHSHDIANYLNSELKAGRSKRIEEIRAEILEKASGIFLWVVLVVQILNKEYDRGRLHALRKRLKEIPTKLNELFKDILMRDAQNMGELLLCIQWILYAKRPLKLVELYFAIIASECPGELGVWNPEEITEENMGNFILSSSKGLAEVTKSADQIVQFIHESVRDFLLKDNGLSELWTKFGSQNSHERLKQCCYNYIKIDMSQELPLKKELPVASTAKATNLRRLTSTKFPFLEYAVRNVLYHADLAAIGGSPQETFIDSFPLKDWIILSNLIERYQVRRYTPNVSLLYIFAEQNLPHLSKIELKRTSNMDIEGERYCYPILAALANGNDDVVKALLMPDVGLQHRNSTPADPYTQYEQDIDALLKEGCGLKVSKGHTLLTHAAEHGKQGLVNLLLATGKVDIDAPGKDARTPLSYAAAHGHDGIVSALFDRGAVLKSRDKGARTPLSYAAEGGHAATVKLLLDRGGMPGSSYGTEAISYAAAKGHTAVVKLLLDKGAKTDYMEANVHKAPLYSAASNGHIALVEILLDRGANPDGRIKFSSKPAIWKAAEEGHEEVVRLLLERGADPESRFSGRTLLSLVAEVGKETVAKMLLQKNVDLESRFHYSGLTPLLYAARAGNTAVVKLLLEKGADLESKSNNGQTALSEAAGAGHTAVVKLLLEKGADLESKCNDGQTALSYAAWMGELETVTLLLEKGADLESKSNNGQTALSEAAGAGHTAVVKLLLEKGAELESKSKNGQTALSYAARKGRTTVVTLLLEKNAELETKSNNGQTALSYAAQEGHTAVAALLLEKGAIVDAKDGCDRTPLHFAAMHYEQGFDFSERFLPNDKTESALELMDISTTAKTVKLFLERGANPRAKDIASNTPLHYAQKNRNSAVVQLLKHCMRKEALRHVVPDDEIIVIE